MGFRLSRLKPVLAALADPEGEAFRRRWHRSSRDFVAAVGACMAVVFHASSLITDPIVAAPAYVPVLKSIHLIVLGAILVWALGLRPLGVKLRHFFYPLTVFSVAAYAYVLHLCVMNDAPLVDITLASAAVLAVALFCILLCPTDWPVVAGTAVLYLGMIWVAYGGHPTASRWFVIDVLAIGSAASFHFGRVLLAQRQAAQEFMRLNSLGAKARGENIKRRDAERQLKVERAKAEHAAKMASLAEMTGGIAHEIGNPLSVIRVRAERVADLLGSGGAPAEEQARQAAEAVRRIVATVERIDKIMKGLRNITRNGEADPFAPARVAELVADVAELCQTRFKMQQTTLEIEPLAPDLVLECRAVEVAQVLVNLLNNASDAVATLPERWVRLAVADRGEAVELRVVDSGSGIPEAVRDRLFEAFYTTKEPGKGTGLGLSIAKAIVEAHDGELAVDADADHTTFVVTLPKRQAGRGDGVSPFAAA